jgi:hypothetical protein
MDTAIRFGTCKPRRRAGASRHLTVRAEGDLHRDEWTSAAHDGEERRVEPLGVRTEDADADVNAARAQQLEAASGDERIRILCRDNDALDTGGGDSGCAGRRASGVAARLQRAVERGAGRCAAGRFERQHFGVRGAGALVSPHTDDRAVVLDEQRTNHRIRRRLSAAALGHLQRLAHEKVVAH